MNKKLMVSEILANLDVEWTDDQYGAASAFLEFQLHCLDIFIRKNRQYGNSFEEVGAKGAYIEIQAKHARLRELLWKADAEVIAQNHGDIQQNSLDLANYAVILCICMAAGNVYGVDSNG